MSDVTNRPPQLGYANCNRQAGAFRQSLGMGGVMVKPENQVDKNRFEERKDTAERSGKNEVAATKQAASSVKRQRDDEGRSKKDNP